MKIGILTALVLLAPLARLDAQTEQLDPTFVKARFVYPISLYRSGDVSWIELVSCKEGGKKCEKLLAKIRVQDLKAKDSIFADIDRAGVLTLNFRQGEGKNVVLTRQTRERGWFPPSELCKGTSSSASCHYVITRDPSTMSLSLQIFAGEGK